MSFVKKLDTPALFDAIPSGIKTLATLKPHEKDRYSVWWNVFKGDKSITGPTNNNIAWPNNGKQFSSTFATQTSSPNSSQLLYVTGSRVWPTFS